jgi:hypothetical protein
MQETLARIERSLLVLRDYIVTPRDLQGEARQGAILAVYSALGDTFAAGAALAAAGGWPAAAREGRSGGAGAPRAGAGAAPPMQRHLLCLGCARHFELQEAVGRGMLRCPSCHEWRLAVSSAIRDCVALATDRFNGAPHRPLPAEVVA